MQKWLGLQFSGYGFQLIYFVPMQSLILDK